LHFEGEIYELYLRPEFQGLGFGRRLFTAAKRDLAQSGLKSMVVWALSDNDPATEFYRALGGRMVARSSEKFGPKSLDKVAFAWTNGPQRKPRRTRDGRPDTVCFDLRPHGAVPCALTLSRSGSIPRARSMSSSKSRSAASRSNTRWTRRP